MSLLKSIKDDLNTNQWVVDHQTDGLSHEDSLLQLPFRGNCLNWVLGHVIESRVTMLERLGEEPPWDEQSRARYRHGSEPVTDGSDAMSLEQLLSDFKDFGTRIHAGLDKMDESDLDQIIDEESGRTLGQSLHFAAWHEAYHLGQTEYLRQLAGKDDQVI